MAGSDEAKMWRLTAALTELARRGYSVAAVSENHQVSLVFGKKHDTGVDPTHFVYYDKDLNMYSLYTPESGVSDE